jgi:hypothetical protein
MRIINVVEITNGCVLSIESFIIHEEQLSREVVENAEKLYKTKAIEHGANEEDFDDEVGYDNYTNGDYCVQIVWSDD